MSHQSSLLQAVFGFLLISTACAYGAETTVRFQDLPPAVQTAAREQSKGAVVRGYSQETEHGTIYYEVELLQDGKTKDILLDTSGSLVEVEQQVDFATLPPAVSQVLKNEARGGKIKKVESVTKGGKLTSYEATVLKNGKHLEIAVAPDGTPILQD